MFLSQIQLCVCMYVCMFYLDIYLYRYSYSSIYRYILSLFFFNTQGLHIYIYVQLYNLDVEIDEIRDRQ